MVIPILCILGGFLCLVVFLLTPPNRSHGNRSGTGSAHASPSQTPGPLSNSEPAPAPNLSIKPDNTFEQSAVQDIATAPVASIHPYDLLQDPFQYKNKLVLLDGRGYPIFANGVYWSYMEYQGNPIRIKVGYSGLRLNRMIDESTGLYDMMAHEASVTTEMSFNGISDMQFIGQLAVVWIHSEAPPSIERAWIVRPLGTISGTNGVGAAITVPCVQFIRYAPDSAPGSLSNSVPAQSINVDKRVRTSEPKPTEQEPVNYATAPAVAAIHPYDLLQNPFQHKHEVVLLDGRGYPIFANGVYWSYENQVNPVGIKVGYSGLHFNRMVAESTALYDVMAHEGADMRVIGQLAVLWSWIHPEAHIGETPPKIERAWIVVPLGTISGTNSFGAAITVPCVQFIRFAD
jgi:hypothetical protein